MSVERELLERAIYFLEPLDWDANVQDTCQDLIKEITELLAQPEHKREPVAWKETLIERFQSAFDSEMFQTDEGEALILLEDAICYIEEFAPPKRKPLSNEDIANLEIQSKTLDTLDYRYGFIEGFLCAEKAHDITGVDDE
jgi:hypothetical protein